MPIIVIFMPNAPICFSSCQNYAKAQMMSLRVGGVHPIAYELLPNRQGDGRIAADRGSDHSDDA